MEDKSQILEQRLPLIPKGMRKNLTEKQLLVIVKYKSQQKLKAVLRWRKLLFSAGATQADLATRTSRPKTRVSEYLNLKKEPNDSTFDVFEKAIDAIITE